jgi:hypothetical protein
MVRLWTVFCVCVLVRFEKCTTRRHVCHNARLRNVAVMFVWVWSFAIRRIWIRVQAMDSFIRGYTKDTASSGSGGSRFFVFAQFAPIVLAVRTGSAIFSSTSTPSSWKKVRGRGPVVVKECCFDRSIGGLSRRSSQHQSLPRFVLVGSRPMPPPRPTHPPKQPPRGFRTQP